MKEATREENPSKIPLSSQLNPMNMSPSYERGDLIIIPKHYRESRCFERCIFMEKKK